MKLAVGSLVLLVLLAFFPPFSDRGGKGKGSDGGIRLTWGTPTKKKGRR